MVKYTLHHFKVAGGRAEPARIMFELADIDYIFKSYGKPEWAEAKKNGDYQNIYFLWFVSSSKCWFKKFKAIENLKVK